MIEKCPQCNLPKFSQHGDGFGISCVCWKPPLYDQGTIDGLQEKIQQLQSALETESALLRECRANERCAMEYLAEIRAIVGGKDFPDMVRLIGEAVSIVGAFASRDFSEVEKAIRVRTQKEAS